MERNHCARFAFGVAVDGVLGNDVLRTATFRLSYPGNALQRWLLVEAAHAAARCHPDWRRQVVHLAMRRQPQVARVALARKLAVRLYWMLHRDGITSRC